MINLGVRAHDFGKTTAEELAKRIGEFGFSGIQLALSKAISGMTNEPGLLNPGMGNYFRDQFRQYGIQVAILGCYINPIHPDPASREKSLLRFEEHLRFARDFGCAIVATETGSCMPDSSFSPQTQKEAAFQDFVDVIKRLVKTAENYGTIVGIEGVAHQHTIHTHERMVRLLELVDSPNLKVVYDPVNFIPNDRCLDHEKHIQEAFDLFGDHIVAIHAKDFILVDGKKQGHLSAGQGELSYPYLLRLLIERKPWIHVLLENTSPESVQKCIDYIREQEEKLEF